MKLLALSLIFVVTSSYTTGSDVYICGPTGAKKYHYKENCRGLSSCNHGVKKVTLKEAQGYGLTLCGWED
ncbi:hypothetical protein LZZ90_09860 [Flavobacterium sp. SM15]|uniref:hypothetical protein n=1 Tax=Flavobacterium sp. SM15 TaxID=2908005 RepID=UPI001EDC3C78|nr:hypothetical protein [Flavobacterium sp. SM15]MCG2611808.1 hypothetical protein [Flavobacterium sp. SM15]